MPATALKLAEAAELTRTGDIWIFRGRTKADRMIQSMTNSPVNHVGMAVVLADLPPLLWHAELGKSLTDMWTGQHQRGVQLHDLSAAVRVWGERYGQRGWLRQLDPVVTKDMEDAVLKVIARLDGMPFPSTSQLAWRWLRGRSPVKIPRGQLETVYCAEVVAMTYEAMGLIAPGRDHGWYDPGRFWSGDRLPLLGGHRLGDELQVDL